MTAPKCPICLGPLDDIAICRECWEEEKAWSQRT